MAKCAVCCYSNAVAEQKRFDNPQTRAAVEVTKEKLEAAVLRCQTFKFCDQHKDFIIDGLPFARAA